MPDITVMSAGDTTDPEEFGGTPHRLVTALRGVGCAAEGLDLSEKHLDRLWRLMWLCTRAANKRRLVYGWQWSEDAHRRRSQRFARAKTVGSLVSFFQLPPDAAGSKLYFYIDGTLSQLFSEYGEASRVEPAVKKAALVREQAAYGRAEHVWVKTREAARSVTYDYGVAPSKVSVLSPGPNLDTELLRWEPVPVGVGLTPATPLHLVAVGKDFNRKGIDRCVDFVDVLLASGVYAELHVVGLTAAQVPGPSRRPWMHCHGLVHKSGSLGTFERLLSRCHVGLLLARAEMAGLAFIEYQAAGLIAVGSGVGGMSELGFTSTVRWVGPSRDDLGAAARSLSELVLDGSLAGGLEVARQQADRVPSWSDVARTMKAKIQ